MVCGVFLLLVALILVDSIRLWVGILNGSRAVVTHDTPFVPSQLNAEEI